MITVTLKRSSKNLFGVHGALYLGSSWLCYTEEPQDKGNKEDISCIPLGTYHCTPHTSKDHPNTWQLNNVPGRTNVLIHSGNTLKDTKGCILVGLMQGMDGVLLSVSAMKKLKTVLPAEFMLQIIEDDSAPLNA